MATTAKRVKDAKSLREGGKKCPLCKGTKAVDGKECLACGGKGKIFTSRQHNRCMLCGRPRAYIRKFGVCRLCFRGLALKGEIPGVAKSSW
jgi:small subunit ribosomal protein S14